MKNETTRIIGGILFGFCLAFGLGVLAAEIMHYDGGIPCECAP